MTPEELRNARRQLGLSLWGMATVLGYAGNYEMRKQMMAHLETGARPIREPQRRLVEALLSGYRPNDWDEVVSGMAAHRSKAETAIEP
jgi:hypothetical protein